MLLWCYGEIMEIHRPFEIELSLGIEELGSGEARERGEPAYKQRAATVIQDTLKMDKNIPSSHERASEQASE